MLRLLKKKKHPASLILTAFAVVAFWRGSWGLMDKYLFPEWPVLSYAVSAALGLLLLYFNDFSLSELEHH